MTPQAQVGPETRLLRNAIGNLRRMGCAVWSLEQHRRSRQTEGVSDLIVAGDGELVALELKAKANLPTDAQWTFLEHWRRADCHALLAWCMDDILWGCRRIGMLERLAEQDVPDVKHLSMRFKKYIPRLYPEWEEELDG